MLRILLGLVAHVACWASESRHIGTEGGLMTLDGVVGLSLLLFRDLDNVLSATECSRMLGFSHIHSRKRSHLRQPGKAKQMRN